MKKFDFSLETVLKLRKSEEKEWENRLASVTGECAKIRNMIANYDSEKMRCAIENESSNISSLIAVSNYQARMDSQKKSSQSDLAQKEKERESVLMSFIEASKKRKILDKLKDRKLEEYRYQLKKDEAKRDDDLNNAKSARERSL